MTFMHLNQIQLAARWNISHRTLERWRWSGEGPQFIKIGGRVVYRLADIEAYELMQIRKSTSNLSQQLAAEGCLFEDRRYGQLFWLAHPGVLLWPDHFHYHVKYRGMHGYETHHDGQQGYAIWHDPRRPRVLLDEIEGIDICPLVADCLDVPVPRQCVGVNPHRREPK